MARRVPSLLALTGLLTGEVLAVVTLHRLARIDGLGGPGADPVGWLRAASPEDVVAGSLRLVALVLAWWLLLSTTACALAELARVPALVRVSSRLALPGIRRCVERALAASVVASATLTGPVSIAAAGDPPPTVEVRDGRAIETAPVPAPESAPPAPDPPPVPAEPPRQHVVAPGDSLWTIAVDHTLDTDVGAYWARLVEANRDSLRSGNPNLIYPGELLELPPLS